MLSFFKKKKKKKINELNIFHSYDRTSGYSTIKKHSKTSIDTFIMKTKENHSDYRYGFINTEFNGVHYPVFDLDSQEKYNLFISEMKYLGKKYVIFISSSWNNINRYWAILDEEIISPKYYNDNNWLIINDIKYVSHCKDDNEFCVRFLYENLERFPRIIYKSNKPSNNFKKFINKFENLINIEGLEISALVSKNPSLLKKLNRMKKIDRIIN